MRGQVAEGDAARRRHTSSVSLLSLDSSRELGRGSRGTSQRVGSGAANGTANSCCHAEKGAASSKVVPSAKVVSTALQTAKRSRTLRPVTANPACRALLQQAVDQQRHQTTEDHRADALDLFQEHGAHGHWPFEDADAFLDPVAARGRGQHGFIVQSLLIGDQHVPEVDPL
jgi:hypothetical protein